MTAEAYILPWDPVSGTTPGSVICIPAIAPDSVVPCGSSRTWPV